MKTRKENGLTSCIGSLLNINVHKSLMKERERKDSNFPQRNKFSPAWSSPQCKNINMSTPGPFHTGCHTTKERKDN